MLKRYLVFGGTIDDTSGGFQDFLDSFRSLRAALEFAVDFDKHFMVRSDDDPYAARWSHIIDTKKMLKWNFDNIKSGKIEPLNLNRMMNDEDEAF